MNYLFPPGHFFKTNRSWNNLGHDNDLPYLSLKNDEGNDFTGYNNEAINVELDGRTIYCDGEWNTLCLPFNIVQFEGTPLEGFTVMELDVENEYNYHKTGFDNGTLYLNFKNVTSIDAGKPYIVKKEANNINNPMFSWVRINFDTPMPVTSEDGAVSFIGNYSPVSLAQNDTSVLYLGAQDGESYLYYPNEDMSIGSARAYFKLNNGITVGQFDGARLFFGNETTGISTITSLSMKGDKWFDLLGHQLQGKPTRKGLYIHEGRKTVVN